MITGNQPLNPFSPSLQSDSIDIQKKALKQNKGDIAQENWVNKTVEQIKQAVFDPQNPKISSTLTPISAQHSFSSTEIQAILINVIKRDFLFSKNTQQACFQDIKDTLGQHLSAEDKEGLDRLINILNNKEWKELCINIQDFKIKDQELLFNIAMMVAKSSKGDVLFKYIQNFGVQDSQRRREIVEQIIPYLSISDLEELNHFSFDEKDKIKLCEFCEKKITEATDIRNTESYIGVLHYFIQDKEKLNPIILNIWQSLITKGWLSEGAVTSEGLAGVFISTFAADNEELRDQLLSHLEIGQLKKMISNLIKTQPFTGAVIFIIKHIAQFLNKSGENLGLKSNELAQLIEKRPEMLSLILSYSKVFIQDNNIEQLTPFNIAKKFIIEKPSLGKSIHTFNLTSSQRFEIAKTLLQKESPQLFFDNLFKGIENELNDSERLILARILLKKQPLDIHELDLLNIKNPDDLFTLAREVYKIAPQQLLNHLASFQLENTKKIEALEFEDFQRALENQVGIEDFLEKQFYEIRSPNLLKSFGEKLYHRCQQSDERASLYAHWAVKFLEKCAKCLYDQGTDDEGVIQIRLQIATMNLIQKDHALLQIDERLKHPVEIQTAKGKINYGTVFREMDSHQLKGGCMQVRDVKIDGEEKRIVFFKTAYWAADRIRESLNLFQDQNLAQLLIDQGICKSVKVEELPYRYLYYSQEENNFDSTDNRQIYAGKVLTLQLEGLGTIQIGMEKSWGSMINQVQVTLNQGASATDLQKALAVMGLGDLMTPTTEKSLERLKVNTLIHFFYPHLAAKEDKSSDYHEKPIEDLLQELESQEPGITATIKKHLPLLESYEVVPGGETRFRLKNLAKMAGELGGRGFVTDMGADLKRASKHLASILQSGFFSTQQRLAGGHIIEGLSCQRDLETNGADAVYCRLITENAQDKAIPQGGGSRGAIQVFMALEAIEQMPYFHSTDNYGCRNPDDPDYGQYYLQRPGFKEFVESNQNKWINTNEVMFKNHLDPQYIALITYQDPRKTILKELENQLPDDMKKLTEKEQLNYLSTHLQEVTDLLKGHSEFDEQSGKFLGRSLAKHWLLDPLQTIQQALNSQNIDMNDLKIIEENEISSEICQSCYGLDTRIQALEQENAKLALNIKVIDKIVKGEISDNYAQHIKAMREKFQTLSEKDLKQFISPTVLKKIEDLREECQKKITDVDYSGQDSLNRELLTSTWNGVLKNHEIILALYALEELKNRGNQEASASISFTVNTVKNRERTISDCLFICLRDQHPVLLEKLPTNQTENKTLDTLLPRGKEAYLEEYQRRANIEETFLPIFHAIDQAYASLIGEKPAFTTSSDSEFNKPYDVEKWKDDYQKIFNKVEDLIAQKEETTLFSLIAEHYNPADLKSQILNSFWELAKGEKLQVNEMTADELATQLAKSSLFLDQTISHLFYDRLHLLLALKSHDLTIKTQEGEVALNTIIHKIIHSFAQGISTENSIAAEQFYIRILQIYKQINLMEQSP